jgi:hypothetical protein
MLITAKLQQEDIHREEYTEIEYAQEHESFKTLHPLDLEDSDQIFLNFVIDGGC